MKKTFIITVLLSVLLVVGLFAQNSNTSADSPTPHKLSSNVLDAPSKSKNVTAVILFAGDKPFAVVPVTMFSPAPAAPCIAFVEAGTGNRNIFCGTFLLTSAEVKLESKPPTAVANRSDTSANPKQ